jgi:hypothetical protein
MMDDMYDMFLDNKLQVDIVDLLAESDFMSEEVFNKKVSKVMSIDTLHKRFPATGPYGNPSYVFPPELEKNFQKNLVFKITEYSALIF